MKLGDTFLLIKGHLWVVVSLPTADGSIAMVSFTTKRANSDLNCVIQPGEHPFVRHETVIAYEQAQLIPVTHQQKVLQSPALCPPKEPVSAALLERIQRGALVSDLTPQKIQKVIEESLAKQRAGQP